ncbi:phosphatase PAP2 family protein [Paraburkholderia dipogonis]|uniref:phosphatase PAP2 family protein n=1 Tax=Paraburkholderia dipogonis TaxID=1211383 RepID=UPI0038B6E223
MWTAISNVGDAALTLPVALTCALWLRLSDKTLAVRWVVLLVAGMALVGMTKILYAGCGVEISAIGFRVISGHTTLSTAVWTVAIALLWRSTGGNARVGALAGLTVGVLTAFARVFDDAHTVPEVIAGWLLGALVAALFVHPLARSNVKLFRPFAAAAGLLLVTTVAYGHHAPIQAMIDHYSPGICARAWASVSAFF